MNTELTAAQKAGITLKANEAKRAPIAKHFRDYTDRAGRPGSIHDGYMFNGVWFKTLREAKAARG